MVHTTNKAPDPRVGAVLAGGAGARLGAASKPMAPLAGRPLISYPLAAMREVCAEVAVVCKRDTALPLLPEGVERWDEPDEPRHPLTGITYALERAQSDVLVCAADMPFVTPAALRKLLAMREERPVVCAANAGTLTPVLALYSQGALGPLERERENVPLRQTVARLNPATVELTEAISINTPEELRAAERRLSA